MLRLMIALALLAQNPLDELDPKPAAKTNDSEPAAAAAETSPAPAKAESPAAPADEAAPRTSQPGVFGFLDDIMHTGAMGLMLDGGFFMWPILLMGVLAAGVAIERWRTLSMFMGDNRELRERVKELLQSDQEEAALAYCTHETGPSAAVLTAGLRKYVILKKLHYDPAKIEEQVIKAMDDHGVHIVAALEKHLPILASVSSVAPMVGSVGTVWGMIILFQDIVAEMGQTNIIEAAAAGIQLKLLVTVWGLIVGIPAYVAFNYFTVVINRLVLNVEEAATELVETVTLQHAMENRKVPLERLDAPRAEAVRASV